MLNQPNASDPRAAPIEATSTAPLDRTSLGIRVLLSNLPFVLALAFGGDLPQPLLALNVGALLFLAPGLSWTDHRKGDAPIVLFRAVVASLAASLVTWIAMLPLPGPTSRVGFVVTLAVITNAGLFRGARLGWYTARPFAAPLSRMLLIAAALFFAQSYLGAAYFVPALEDQDMETQGTAYGLMHAFSPTMATNRGSRFFFAHPLLLHFWIGESALLSEDLDRLRHYHEGSLALVDTPEDSYAQWDADYQQFLRDPVLLPTRTPNLFLSAFLMFPLGFLAYRMSGSRAAALLTCALYATLPEVYVRTSYGGYMAITNFLTVAGAYFYLHASGLLPARELGAAPLPVTRRGAFGAAFLGGWADQKSILLPMAAPAHALVRVALEGKLGELYRRLRARPEYVAALLIGFGFVAGWITYAIYGMGVAPKAFLGDHIRDHIYKRLKMNDVNLKDMAKGDFVYPSIVALWHQFSEHTGWLVVAVGLPALVRAAKRVREADGMFLLWVLIGVLGFSLVDWRQTKHLAHILPPLALLIGVYWASLASKAKAAVTALLSVAMLWNVWRIGLLMQDFEYLKPLPIW